MKRLMADYDVWIDPANKRVVLDGVVCLREGQLEMLACVKGTKEHESILAVDTKAYAVHAGLLAVGAQAGTPVQFQPAYKPATGTEIDINLIWTDKNGQVHRDRAQDWVRNVQTGKPMEYPWVFAGSGFWTDESTGEKSYLAESGDFICVSNFPQRHARSARRKQPGDRQFALRSLHSAHSAAGDASANGADAEAQKIVTASEFRFAVERAIRRDSV